MDPHRARAETLWTLAHMDPEGQEAKELAGDQMWEVMRACFVNGYLAGVKEAHATQES